MRYQLLYLVFLFLMSGCGIAEEINGDLSASNFPPQMLRERFAENEKSFFTVKEGVLKPKDENNLEFFDGFNLSNDTVAEKQLTFYYYIADKNSVKLSVPFSLFKSGHKLCLPISTQNQFCTKQEINVQDVFNSKTKPLAFELVPNLSKEGNGDYLIIVSPTSVFERENMGSLIQEGLLKFSLEYRSLPNSELAPNFKLRKTASGRIISKEILTKDTLLSSKFNNKNKLESFIKKNFQFNVIDWRPVRDLVLVESQISTTPQGILYITSDDGFSNFESLPRNQCIPLAWKRDRIDLWVITNKGCHVWKEQLGVEHCLELGEFRADSEFGFTKEERPEALKSFHTFISNFFKGEQ